MRRLRARHWLAVTLAAALIVVASSTEVTEVSTDGELTVADGRGADRLAPDSLPTGPQIAGQSAAGKSTSGIETEDPARPSPSPGGQAEDDDRERFPFTGLPAPDGGIDRPALIIKIDNHPRARPQSALDRADIVFDMRAEVVNRFAAVFQSQVPDKVGPVRSSRTSDFDILRGFDTPIYGSSGGNKHVLAGLKTLPIIALTNQTRNEYVRDRSRSAPHNLYIDPNILYDLAPDDLPTPEPWFSYRSDGEELPETAVPVAGPVEIDFTGSSLVTHSWDPDRGGWLRTQDGEPHLSVDGSQLAPENVVILITDYSVSAADPISPEVRSTGGGELIVLTAGHAVNGTWERRNPEDKPLLLDRSGTAIELTPGRTWVLLPEQNQVSLPEDGSGRAIGPEHGLTVG